jgi:ribosomal protein S18 acetylase RimI-like enzyme
MEQATGLQIALASLADSREITKLAVRTYVAAFGEDFEPDELAWHLERTLSVERWKDYLTRDRVLLARIAGQAVGYLQFGPAEGGDGLEIRRVYVEPVHQGRGIGSALLSRALELPELTAAPGLRIDVWQYNHDARRLYERFGFRHAGERKAFVLKSGRIDGYDLVLRRPGGLNPSATGRG